jgi:PAS domain S-box-containing protein
MANSTLRILNVEDSERDVMLVKRHLARSGHDVVLERVDTPQAMRVALEEHDWDVILCDYSMPHFSALSALSLLKEVELDIPFIIISGTIGEEAAVEAMRAGANDYLMKDNLTRLAPAIEREVQEAVNRRARRQAEAELRLSEAQYRRLLDTAYEGIWIADARAHITYANQRLAEMLGYTIEEMIGRSAFEVLDDDTRAEMKTRWLRRIEGIEEQYDLRLLRKDGSTLWVILSATPIRDERGQVTGALAMLTDITERKRAEQLVRLQATALESADNAILISGPDGVISWVNRAFTTLTGYKSEEVLGQNPRILKSGQHDHAFYESMWKTLLTGQVWHGEIVNLRKDGTRYVEEQTITPVVNEAGKITNFIAIKQDITERKRAEEAVKQAEEKYRSIFDNAVEGIFQSTIEGSFISVNPAMARILGYDSAEELIANRADIETQHYVDPDRRAELVRMLAERGVVKGYECEVYRKDRSKLWTVENVRAIRDKSGSVLYYEGSIEDIAERKTLEEQLRQSQKLEGIGMLAGGIAHDFNNLLTVITGYSDLTLLQLRDEDPLHRNITEVKKAAERASALTRQLLAFSRKQVLQPRVLDLNAVISELEKLLRRLIGEDIGFRTVLESDLGNVKADPGQIEQILMNLAINARDAMPNGGELTIETANIYLDEDYAKSHLDVSPGPYVMFALSDTGMGIDQQTQARIFEPFFTTKEAGKGTGLGLSTVYGIVKQSGGNIWVYSEVGRGTTFKVYLPRVDEGAPKYERRIEMESDVLGSETVLVAEDEEMVRKLARRVLEMFGYQVLEAANGGSALLICERHNEPIHLLVTDVIMPEMSGRDLADRLAQLRPGIKVLYMSGYTDDAIVHQGVLDEGANYIQKPFATDALVRKVREVLDGPQKRL